MFCQKIHAHQNRKDEKNPTYFEIKFEPRPFDSVKKQPFSFKQKKNNKNFKETNEEE